MEVRKVELEGRLVDGKCSPSRCCAVGISREFLKVEKVSTAGYSRHWKVLIEVVPWTRQINQATMMLTWQCRGGGAAMTAEKEQRTSQQHKHAASDVPSVKCCTEGKSVDH
jgi:hypothetical protein